MRHAARITTTGYWGKPNPPAFTFNITSEAEFKRALKRGTAAGLSLYREQDDYQDGATPFGLSYRLAFPDAANEKSNWIKTLGEGDYLDAFPFAFRSGKAVGHSSSTTDTSAYQSGSAFIIPQNGAFALRFFLYKPDGESESETRPLDTFRWGRYQFLVEDGQMEVMRLSPNWSQAQEDVLHALLTEEELSEAEQTMADELKEIIYSDRTSVHIGKGEENSYGTTHTLVFIPEARGALTIVADGNKFQTVENKEILATRKTGVLWPATPLDVRTNRGMLLWQVGYPVFAPIGTLRIPYKTGYWTDSLGAMTSAGNWDASAPGTSVEVENNILDSVNAEIVITLKSANLRYTPFVYSVQANIAAGARDGGTGESFDSDDEANCIKNVDLQFEGEGRRAMATVTLRDVNGKTLRHLAIDGGGGDGTLHPALENRVVTLSVDGAAIITNGIVKEARLQNLKTATQNVPSDQVKNSDTEIVLVITDQWGVMDEDMMTDDPIGDGKRLGAYIREVLRNAGVKTAEMTGVSATAGRVLPRAAYGERDAVRPSRGTSRGDYLRSLVEKYGMGLQLFVSAAGVWTLAKKSTTPIAHYVGKEEVGQHRILRGLDSVRDTGDQYNVIRAEGAEDADGNRLADEWIWQESITRGLGPQSNKYIGRRKVYNLPPDDGLRTASDVHLAARSAALYQGKPGRYWSFETHFHTNQYPGDRITAYGRTLEIARIGGANMAANRMQVTGREV